MWRRRLWLWLPLVLLGAFLLVGFLGSVYATSMHPDPSRPGCPLGGTGRLAQLVTPALLSCPPAIPAIWSLTYICGVDVVHGGFQYCTLTIPSLNPADWITWFGNAIACDAVVLWNTLEGYVGNFLVYIINGITADVMSAVNAILGALASAFGAVLGAIDGAVLYVTNAITSVAVGAGPFAPIIVFLLVAALLLGGGIFTYFVVILAVAGFKTAFNLL